MSALPNIKYCMWCDTYKDMTDFGDLKSSKDGKNKRCIDCRKKGATLKKEVLECGLKRCTHCKIIKTVDNFTKNLALKDNKSSFCKECSSIKQKSRKDYHNNYVKERKKKDIHFKIGSNLRTLIKSYLRRGIKNELINKNSTKDILCSSVEEFIRHLEKQFENWMTWDNYGLYNGEVNYGWDLDHIIPITCLKQEDIYLLNHWSNFQPLCSKVNRDVKVNKLYPVTNLELNLTIFNCI